MGSKQSKSMQSQGIDPSNKKCDPGSEVKSFGAKVKAAVDEELGRRMMVQREVQMAVNIAKARDTIQIFGSAWAVFVSGVAGRVAHQLIDRWHDEVLSIVLIGC